MVALFYYTYHLFESFEAPHVEPRLLVFKVTKNYALKHTLSN